MRAPPGSSSRSRYTLIATLLVAILLLVACVATVPNAHAQAVPLPRQAVAGILAIENTQLADVEIYVLRDGTTVRRIGAVPGYTAASFRLKSTDVSYNSQIGFGAHVAGSRAQYDYLTPAVPAVSDQLYRWRLGSPMRAPDFYRWPRQASALDEEPPNRAPSNSHQIALRSRFGLRHGQRTDSTATFVFPPVVVSTP